MTHEIPFRLVALVLISTTFGISVYFRRKADQESGPLNPEGRVQLILLRLAGLAVFTPFILYLINPNWVAWARFPAPSWLRWLGAALTTAMIPLLFWMFHTIGSNISPSHATRQTHQLITAGPYRYIRHPLYTFSMLAWTGIGLLTALWWILVGWAVVLIFVAFRTPQEEAHLLAEFGDAYRDYMIQTGRYWPKFGQRRR